MNTAVINIKTDLKIKKNAQKVAKELGFSLSSLINGFLRQIIRKKSVSFNLNLEEPSPYLIKLIKQIKKDRHKPNYLATKSTQETLEYLNSFIQSSKKIKSKHVNRERDSFVHSFPQANFQSAT